MKIALIALIIYIAVAIIWLIAEIYHSYKSMYKINRVLGYLGVKASVTWYKIILGSIFWPIDIIIGIIRKVAWKRSK